MGRIVQCLRCGITVFDLANGSKKLRSGVAMCGDCMVKEKRDWKSPELPEFLRGFTGKKGGF